MKLFSSLFNLSLCSFGFVCFTNKDILAQVTSDGTVNTQVTQDENVAEITGGETRGDNLFHSFQDFSVPTGNEAFFNNSNDISNIFSRVTGGNISNIDGAIQANGSANLFLINPTGIIFGENARLDIGGSFLSSTSSSILFEDGEFSAIKNLEEPILTVNAPIGLSFRDEPGDIINRSTANNGRGLEVNSGSNISFLGGNINFDRGIATAPGGIVNLGGLSGTGIINFEPDNILSFPDDVAQSNISLSNNAVVNITGSGGGLIRINANTLNLTEESLLLANIGEGLGSENAVAGTIEINSTAFSAENNSLINADNLGTGRAGDINVITDTLNFNSGSAITATTFGVGDAGNISVTARDITLDFEFTGFYSNVGLTNIASESEESDVSGVVGNGGIIDIDTDTLTLTNGARIISSSIAQGDGGTVNINATGEVSYIGQGETPVPAFGGGEDNVVISGSFSQVQQDGNGNSGEVNIAADSLRLIDKGAVLTDNSGVGGDAGDINLNIANNIFLDQTGLILAQVQSGAEGNGGDININANSLEALEFSFILADTKGIGSAGNININVAETISLDTGSVILTEVGESAEGNGGNITIVSDELIADNGSSITARTSGVGNGGNVFLTIGELSLDNGSSISADTSGVGNAGNITIETSGINDLISLANGAEIRSTVEGTGDGTGGNISLDSGELNLNNSSKIIADTSGEGNAGNIDISIFGGDINLDNSNQIQSQKRGEGEGNAGNISIQTDGSLFSTGGNLILADSQAIGNGGNITITVGEQILLEGSSEGGFPSQIVAGLSRENAQGIGGNIEIQAGEIVLDDLAFITSNTVSNTIGSAGNITIGADSINLNNNSFINAFTANDSNGGAIAINAQTLNLESGGKILAASAGGGDAGNIQVTVSDRVTIDNSIESSASFVDFGAGSQLLNDLQNEPSGIYADTTENSSGNGGNVNIGLSTEQVPQEFVISNGGQIVVDSRGTGIGGNIFLRSQTLELDNGTISASTQVGQDDSTDLQSGSITLEIAEDLTLKNNSSISTEAFNDADGGNLNIDSNFIIAFPSSGEGNDIITRAEQGRGGDININSTLLGITEGLATGGNNSSDIDASSEFSLDGNITINNPDNGLIQGTIELPNNIIEPKETIAQACQADRKTANTNSFVIKGKGGIPAAPGSPLNSNNITINGETSSTSVTPKSIETSQGKIQPARGIEITESGEMILTAHRTDNSGERLSESKTNCGV